MRKYAIFLILIFAAVNAYADRAVGDLDGSGKVDFQDFLIFAGNFGNEGDPYDPNEPVLPAVPDTVRVTVPGTVSLLPNGETVDPVSGANEITIASFDIRLFSTGSRDDAELEAIADRLQQFDLIAIQEVNDVQVVDRTRSILANRGIIYGAFISNGVGRESLERYAYLWRTDKIVSLGAARLWEDTEDWFSREPYIATFRAGSFDFTLITFRAISSSSVTESRVEGLLIDDVYNAIQNENMQESDVIVLGNFNLEPDDLGMEHLTALLTPIFKGDTKTTVSATSLFDNIWLPIGAETEYSGRYGG